MWEMFESSRHNTSRVCMDTTQRLYPIFAHELQMRMTANLLQRPIIPAIEVLDFLLAGIFQMHFYYLLADMFHMNFSYERRVLWQASTHVTINHLPP